MTKAGSISTTKIYRVFSVKQQNYQLFGKLNSSITRSVFVFLIITSSVGNFSRSATFLVLARKPQFVPRSWSGRFVLKRSSFWNVISPKRHVSEQKYCKYWRKWPLNFVSIFRCVKCWRNNPKHNSYQFCGRFMSITSDTVDYPEYGNVRSICGVY